MVSIRKNQPNFICLVLLTAGLVLAEFVSAQDQLTNNNLPSIDGHFFITLQSKTEPIPLNKIHQWILHVKDKNELPVSDATILLDGGMPAHNHGLPTQPSATSLGEGSYLIDGIKFSMTGVWELWVYIQTDKITDRVRLELKF